MHKERTMKTLLKPIPLALWLAGCSLAPNYEQPDVALPQSWMEVAISEQGNAAAPTADTLGWREYFRDPQLQQLISEALAHNHDLKNAALSIEIAEAQYGIQRTDYLPSVNAQGARARSRTPADLTGTGQARIGETWTVGLATSADLAQRVLKTRQETYRLSKLQFDAGLMTAGDLRGVEAQIESARSSYSEAERSHQQALNALSKLVGKPVSQIQLPPAGDLRNQFADIRLPSGIPSAALQHRPDIREAEYKIKAANGDIGAARAALYPSIALTGNLGFGSTELDRLIKAPNLSWSFTPSINIPIFNRGKLNRAVTISEAQQKILVETYQKAVQTAFYEIADALTARQTLAEQYEAQQRGNSAVSDRLRLENLRFEAGISTALDRLDAQRESYASDQGLLATELQMLTNNVDLYIAMGGGLHEYGVTAPDVAKDTTPAKANKAAPRTKKR